ncbi:YIP1 family protein [Desulfovibrio desulfuricans]|uniref:YIP1 family protein n=1 Tax=Desulfovibrio desulfuricans TaxID=876 RepID=UPI00048144B7|nr:YIP1 family protein [Desulfovibrio desulfuricans]
MNITCPRCGFSRELPADRLPSKAVIATCPHCACRFRLVPGVGVMDVLSEPEHPVENPAHSGDSEAAAARPENLGAEEHGRGAWQSGDDDPLPPGAIVPGHSAQKPSRAEDERGESREPAQKPQSGRKFPQADTGEERHIGNLWGLLGGKNIFGQRVDKSSEKRAGDRDDDNQQKRNSQRGLFGPADDDADDSRNASAAYARESSRFENDREDNQDDGQHGPANPWEAAPEPDGWIPAFYHTCMRVMFGAHNFFAHMRAESSQVRPLVFYLIISVIQVVIERVWSGIFLSLMAPSAASDPELEKMLILLSPQLSLPMTILIKTGVSVVQLYVLTALMHFTYGFITGKKPEFSLVFQVAAYAAAPSLLCVVPLLGSIVGFIWMIACVLVGCRTVLNLTWPQTFMGFAPVVLLLAPLLLQVMKAAQF